MSKAPGRPDLNNPPTAVGGIPIVRDKADFPTAAAEVVVERILD